MVGEGIKGERGYAVLYDKTSMTSQHGKPAAHVLRRVSKCVL